MVIIKLNIVFRIVGELQSKEELDCLIKYISRARFLTVFVHRRGADDMTLQKLGAHCPALQVK